MWAVAIRRELAPFLPFRVEVKSSLLLAPHCEGRVAISREFRVM